MTSVPFEPELGMVDVVEQAASPPRRWRLALNRAEAWLFVPNESFAFAFSHEELAKHGNIVLWRRFIALVLNGLLPGGRALAFRIDGDAMAIFRRWIHEAREVHVANASKRRTRLALPLGIVWILLALPILGSRVDPFSLTFGIGLVALGLLASRYPHPRIFIVDAVVWGALAASQIEHVARTGSKLSIVFALFSALVSVQALRAFRFYR